MGNINSGFNNDLYEGSILVVDDEASNIKLLEKLLSMSGYKNIACTQDPVQVLPLYKEHNYDLILLDLKMDELDGYAVMEQLDSVTEGNLPPIMILTSQHSPGFRQRALDNGARDYLTKPFDTRELLSRVRNLLDAQIAQKTMRHQNECLEQMVKERTQAIHHTRLQVIRCLGRAAEYRDNETGLHIIRMSKIAYLLGQEAGLNDEQSDLLLNAAPMHDIGKIGIPDKILLKPGKLDADEWAIMQTHTQIGADILSGEQSDLMNMACEIAISHHEKWDGSGYPNGLEGKSIPLVGRITALADVFDALTSKRPYKDAWPVMEAVNYIKEKSGKQFDPELVDIFLSKLPNIIDIMEKYAEPEGEFE